MKIIEKGLVGLAPRRQRAGLTQKQLAEALGCTQALVSLYESGDAWPRARDLPAISDLLGCTIDELYEPMPAEFILSEGGAG